MFGVAIIIVTCGMDKHSRCHRVWVENWTNDLNIALGFLDPVISGLMVEVFRTPQSLRSFFLRNIFEFQ